jgi:hypothetical protein
LLKASSPHLPSWIAPNATFQALESSFPNNNRHPSREAERQIEPAIITPDRTLIHAIRFAQSRPDVVTMLKESPGIYERSLDKDNRCIHRNRACGWMMLGNLVRRIGRLCGEDSGSGHFRNLQANAILSVSNRLRLTNIVSEIACFRKMPPSDFRVAAKHWPNIGDGQSRSIHDVSKNNFRQLNHKPSQPGILFKQRYNVVPVFVTPVRRFMEPKLLALRRICGSHG